MKDYFRDEYKKLVGLKVTGVVKDSSDEFEELYGLKMSNGTIVWILCDPEGNGPGFLDIQEKE